MPGNETRHGIVPRVSMPYNGTSRPIATKTFLKDNLPGEPPF